MAGFKVGSPSLYNPESPSRPSLNKPVSAVKSAGARGYSGGADVQPLGSSSSRGAPSAAPVVRAPRTAPQKAAAQAPQPAQAPVPQTPASKEVNKATAPLRDAGVVPLAHPAAVTPTKEAFQKIYDIVTAMGAKPDFDAHQKTFDFSDNELSPVVIDTVLSCCLGTEWWGWEPETFQDAINKLKGFGVDLSQNNRDKAQAMAAIHVTNAPWMDHFVFEKIALALNGASPAFGHYEDVSPGMLLYCVDVMRKTNDYEFSPEVIKYIAAKHVEHGTLIFPDDELQETVGSNIYYLVDDELSKSEFSDINEKWKEFESSGGMDAGADVIDGLSDEDLTDMSVVRAYLSKRFLLDEQKLEMEQLNSLCSWAAAIVGKK